MIAALLVGTVIGLLLYAFVRWATANNAYFVNKNIPHLRPHFLFGNTGGLFLNRHRPDEYHTRLYNTFSTTKVFGVYDFRQPVIVLRDPQVIKQILVKDFDNFLNHRQLIDRTVDEVLGNSLFQLQDQRWRQMRATLSPAFTGRKMRLMFELVNDCCTDMTSALRVKLEEKLREDTGGNNEQMALDMREMFGRCTIDVIASTVFGYRVNSFADETNVFYVYSKELLNFKKFSTILKFMGMVFCPWLMRTLRITLFAPKVMDFFKDLVMQTMRERETSENLRPDMISLLMPLKKNQSIDQKEQEGEHLLAKNSDCTSLVDGFATAEDSSIASPNTKNIQWSDNEIVAQAFVFFFVGFDSTSSMLSFLAYELAINPQAQQTLYEECRAVQQELLNPTGAESSLPYERLQRMSYMDQVVCEVMRMWTPLMVADRVCGKTYNYDDGEFQLQIEKDIYIWLPIYGLHHDPKYFPDPDRFIPERFSEENRHSIVPGSYLPFGVGPRNCIASRYALMVVKAAIYHLLLTFKFEPTAKTQIPLKLAKTPGVLQSEYGIHLGLKLREGLTSK